MKEEEREIFGLDLDLDEEGMEGDGREWHPNVRKIDWWNFGMESDLGVESAATLSWGSRWH